MRKWLIKMEKMSELNEASVIRELRSNAKLSNYYIRRLGADRSQSIVSYLDEYGQAYNILSGSDEFFSVCLKVLMELGAPEVWSRKDEESLIEKMRSQLTD